MSHLDKFLTPEVVSLARVRTPAGSAKYDAPIGHPIVEDAPAGQRIRANGIKPGQQIKTAAGYQTVGVTREDRVRKGIIHVFGTNGKLLLTVRSNAPVAIKVRTPDAESKEDTVNLTKVISATEKKPASPAPKPEHAVLTTKTKPVYTRNNWRAEFVKHVKAAYPGVSISLAEKSAGHVALDAIKVDAKARGQGLANKAMKELMDLADAVGVTLTLNPAESDGKLAQWYSAWGFVGNAGKDVDETIKESLHRKPKGGVKPPVEEGTDFTEVNPL